MWEDALAIQRNFYVKKKSLYAFTKEINWEAALAIKGNFSDKNQKLIVLYKGH